MTDHLRQNISVGQFVKSYIGPVHFPENFLSCMPLLCFEVVSEVWAKLATINSIYTHHLQIYNTIDKLKEEERCATKRRYMWNTILASFVVTHRVVPLLFLQCSDDISHKSSGEAKSFDVQILKLSGLWAFLSVSENSINKWSHLKLNLRINLFLHKLLFAHQKLIKHSACCYLWLAL